MVYICLLNPFDGAELNRKIVTFLAEEAKGYSIENLKKKKSNEEEMHVDKMEIYLHCPNGYGITKLSNTYLEKVLGVTCTSRNWRTIIKLREIANNEGN